MLAAVEFDKALYDALLEKALETIDALSPADVIIDTEWARAMVERLLAFISLKDSSPCVIVPFPVFPTKHFYLRSE